MQLLVTSPSDDLIAMDRGKAGLLLDGRTRPWGVVIVIMLSALTARALAMTIGCAWSCCSANTEIASSPSRLMSAGKGDHQPLDLMISQTGSGPAPLLPPIMQEAGKYDGIRKVLHDCQNATDTAQLRKRAYRQGTPSMSH